MTKKTSLIITAVLVLSTALFTYFVFFPTIRPYEVVDVEVEDTVVPEEVIEEVIPEEKIDNIQTKWNLQLDQTGILEAEVLNREIPDNWMGRKIFFRYTYIGEYDDNTQSKLDELLVTEYQWQKQLDKDGNVVMGGIILKKDGTYQLHTHNTFTKAQWRYLLGDLLDRYYSNEELIGTKIKFGSIILEAEWFRDIELERGNLVPYADLIISTCLERWGDRRLVSGWTVVEDKSVSITNSL